MNSFVLPIFCFFAIGLAGCNSKEKCARSNRAAKAWLSVNAGSAAANIAGVWFAKETAWGTIRFQQEGSRISGVMGDCQVDGQMNGSIAYLTLSSGGCVRYSVVAKKRGLILSGFYSASVPFSTVDQKPLELKRVE